MKIESRHGWQTAITQAHLNAGRALLAERRRTNGYADLGDLMTAAGFTFDVSTAEGSAARARAETDLVDMFATMRDVSCREGRYRLLA
jgi:hypothetical protein